MGTIIYLIIRYNKEYLWFAPIAIGLSLIILLSIIKVLFIYRKKKTIITEDIKEPQKSPQVAISDNDLIPLSKVVETLIQEGKRQNQIKGLDFDIEMQNDADGYYEPFGKLIARYVDIYGKRPSSSFNKWEKISEDMILIGEFRKLCSEIYLKNYIDRGPEFIDLAIKQDELDKVIQRIMSENRPFDWLSYEVKDL